MRIPAQPPFTTRYRLVTEEKASGATYTPKILADFVARQITDTAGPLPTDRPVRILDPCLGHGELLVSLLHQLSNHSTLTLSVHGFETHLTSLEIAMDRLTGMYPNVNFHFNSHSFLDFVLNNFTTNGDDTLFPKIIPETYDIVIANPPYVRTQIIGAPQAQTLAQQFGLTGRVDLYYAFLLGMSQVLNPQGTAGIIVSNRFMTTRSGASVRQTLRDRFNLRHIWDLGDTRLFTAAVLPAVLLVEGRLRPKIHNPIFTSIYQATGTPDATVTDPVAALDEDGIVEVQDGRRFRVRRGTLKPANTPDAIWRIATGSTEAWLAKVEARTWGTFRDIGKVRVGVKTCADKVFVRSDWHNISIAARPELLKPITTHHIARRFRPLTPKHPKEVLYPHQIDHGHRRPVDLNNYPHSRAYLEEHRPILERRHYLLNAGRHWYELWVPQDPGAWHKPKLVFRDIADEPTFWLDLQGSVINGDCYWIVSRNSEQTDLLWLAAAVGNSTFIEHFYDLSFNNKLYAGRRRFITQYVEKFPLPNPFSPDGAAIISTAKQVYDCTPSEEAEQLLKELNLMVWKALTGGHEFSF